MQSAIPRRSQGSEEVHIGRQSFDEWRSRCPQECARLHNPFMEIAKTLGLFIVTALAEIVGCYLPHLWLKQGGSPWLLLPAAASLALFAWLLSLHPTAAGRVYAA